MSNITRIKCEGFTEEDLKDPDQQEFFDDVGRENIPMEDYDVWSCNDCGASSLESAEKIVHHKTCVPGESKKWMEYYSQPEEDEDEEGL